MMSPPTSKTPTYIIPEVRHVFTRDGKVLSCPVFGSILYGLFCMHHKFGFDSVSVFVFATLSSVLFGSSYVTFNGWTLLITGHRMF